MMKYKLSIFFGLVFIMFFSFTSFSRAVSLIEPPVVNGVTNSAWQYQGSVKGVAWYMKGTYFSNPDGSLQFATSADFSAYLAQPDVISPTGGLTSTIPMGPNGLNPGWQDQGGGWYFKNPTYSDAYGSVQFNSLAELNAYLAAEEAKKVTVALPPTTGCTGYENNPACRPEWAEGVSACVPGTLIVSSNNTNGQCGYSYTKSNKPDIPIQTCNSIISDGPCRPERVNPYATASIAKKAEAVAKVKGYTNTTCSVTKPTIPDPGIDSNTGLRYYYNVDCTINGKTGIGAEWMINGSNYWWSNLNDYLSGKGDYSSSLISKKDGSASATPPTTATPPTSGTDSSLPPTTNSGTGAITTPPSGASGPNPVINYVQSIFSTYTQRAEETRRDFYSSGTGATSVENKIITDANIGATRSSCLTSFNVDLKLGSTGADVRTLTTYLMEKGLYPNMESTFDQTVFDAVVAFQNVNKDEILTPVGLTSGTGFVGVNTRKFINNEICPQGASGTPPKTPPTTNPIPPSTTKAVFTSNVSGNMRVGDSWNIVVTGLKPNETIYATGGKKVNGIVPLDKTPYTADSLGIYSKISSHAPDVIGDWQLVWTRADGSNLGTLIFSVKPFTLPFITSVTSTSVKTGSSFQILGGGFNQINTIPELINSQGASVTLPVVSMTGDVMTVSVPSGTVVGVYTLQIRFIGTGVNFGKISNTVSMTVTI